MNAKLITLFNFHHGMRCVQRQHLQDNRARQLYKNISMLFLFPVKDGKLSTGVNATFDASCYGSVSYTHLTLPTILRV